MLEAILGGLILAAVAVGINKLTRRHPKAIIVIRIILVLVFIFVFLTFAIALANE